jgi:polar amino acid transport system substrate-binding protein
MRNRRPTSGAFALLLSSLLAAATVGGCSGAAAPSPAAPSTDPRTDKLAQVVSRGTLVLWTDLAYPPQSFAVERARRTPGTKCAANELTADEVAGYDADTGKLVAAALGVEACFVTPPWNEVIAGNWGDRWDVAWGSGALTEERMTRLYVTQPYYSTPHTFFVPTDSPVRTTADLEGREVGACAGCTQEQYLRHTLELPGETLDYAIERPKVVTYDAEPAGLEATAAHEIDAFLCSEPVGLELIRQGVALRVLPKPAYVTQKTGYADRGSSLAMGPFLDRVNAALRSLHAAGSLKRLSEQYFGTDYATAAGRFDLDAVHQEVR